MPQLNIWDIGMLVGIAQGLVMAMVLWFKKGTSISSKFLAVIFFALAVGGLINFASEHPPEEMTRFNLWFAKYLAIYPVMLLGPSLLFFVQSQVDKGFVLDTQKRRHYWAVLFNLIPTLTWTLAGITQLLQLPFFSDDQLTVFLGVFFTYGDAVFWLHILTYTLLAKNYLQQQKTGNHTRLFQIIRAFQLLLAVWFPFLVIYVSPYQGMLIDFSYYPIFIPMTILVYWLGFHWFFHLYKSVSPARKPVEGHEELALQLKKAMDAGLYLDPELTVKSTAQQLGVPQRTLSMCINDQFSQTFNDFLNAYRVEAVKQKLADPKYDHFTMAAIAHDSGFKSIATFQRVFKQLEGMSPTALKKQLVKD